MGVDDSTVLLTIVHKNYTFRGQKTLFQDNVQIHRLLEFVCIEKDEIKFTFERFQPRILVN